MKRKINPFFLVYEFLIVLPIWAVITILAALTTIILSPIFPNSKISYFPGRFWARSICALCFIPVKVYGMEKLDRNQSYIFAINHQSWFDIFTVYGWLPFFFKWIMKTDLRKIPFVGAACQAAGHIFINRESPQEAKKSLEKAKQELQHGISVVIFPEGTRTKNGALGKFKKGGFKIATDIGLPIVPVTLRGCFERMPRNTLLISPGSIEMHIHEPIDVSAYSGENLSELMQRTWDTINDAL
ncbi:1-acyl-sn-glycerol-3-phosphate acyltransferase [Paludibacter sp. 221]|uniref:lysophospholipid acyltransferase family protein n=1 Tax=Paludibacter sp. 221 TaxID=2302939 RepID=UPI0013D607CC|nr:lysophospholipid acyltransferase family protein [Paludibacter sp. 221]NDV45791.1 1-acyl-sn-glycerol-3-phosphate acyltransferase [Paludibacter sp. 221]